MMRREHEEKGLGARNTEPVAEPAGAPNAEPAGARTAESIGARSTLPGARMDESKLRALNADALAYMGDAVYESMIRERLLQQGNVRADRLHHKATAYVCAEAQAKIIRTLYDELTEQEQSMVKRWRNHRFHSKAKHADPMTYKWATAFEALAGYLYLAGDAQRLDWLFVRAAEIIDAQAPQR